MKEKQIMQTYCYLVAIGTAQPTKEFNAFIEKFAPRFDLRTGVYVLFHATKLSIQELRQLVEETLPDSVPFFVSIPQDYEHVPVREAPQETGASDPV